MKEGSGKITVNKKDYQEYFNTPSLQYIVRQPFEITETTGKFDISVNLTGGGITGQAEALRLAGHRPRLQAGRRAVRGAFRGAAQGHRVEVPARARLRAQQSAGQGG